MKTVVTIKLKIPMNPILLETMKQYSQSMQSVIDCGYSLNADLNGAINIASKHHNKLDDVSAFVTKPHIQTDEHKGSLRTTACEVMDNHFKNVKPFALARG